MRTSKTKTSLLAGECRVIHVSKNELFELIYETMIERMEEYFDILDLSCMIYHWGIADTLDSFYFGIHDSRFKGKPSPEEIIPLIGYTTDSLVDKKIRPRYKTVYQKGDSYEINASAHRKVKHLQDGEYRFIHASYTALIEFVQDSIIEKINFYFCINRCAKVKWISRIDRNLDFIFAVYNVEDKEPDLSKLSQEIGFTTHSFFSSNIKYKSVFMV